MKTKIILFLVLLIPSLCFGRSVMIETIDDREFQKFQIVIHDSLTMKVKRIEFASKGGGQVFYAECKNSFIKLKEFLKFLFPQSYEKRWKDTLLSGKGNNSFNITWVMGEIRRFAVYENYQITSYSERKMEDADVRFQTLFIYKNP